ncbi:AraC family transcriptional regulator [Acinetobacter rathckeae]|uniref:AraC family transcriptional regulator n=1 Tax=Acinetobacter rathckeae TaxID=2605272 RepID=UPI0018A2716B|nr:AraC family transcriptional regulator [Acinetobacter rathckeae]MBF7688135.1 helix-turn-helix transcriptional regulator [Acinetobacter rathckeae]
MKAELISLAKHVLENSFAVDPPFSIYSAHQVQIIQNVPILKPLLIFVLSGLKAFGKHGDIQCLAGEFILLSASTQMDMRNIPHQEEYFAVLIDCEYADFHDLPQGFGVPKPYVKGEVDPALALALKQFIEISSVAPLVVTSDRKKELLKLIYHAGYSDISNLYKHLTISEKVQSLLCENRLQDYTAEQIASSLFMSVSTLRRKLKRESDCLSEIKHRVRLAHGLHLIQTTHWSIGHIASECGYVSASRFTEQFKHRFGMTPRAIRKTKLHVESE